MKSAMSGHRYRTIDLVTVAMLGVAVGAVYWGWDKIYEPISNAALFGYPPSKGLLGGVWLFAGVVGGLIVRKPGAAFLTELVAAIVETIILGGNQWGWSTLASGMLQGLGAELVFAVLLYRRFGPGAAMLAGVVAAGFEVGYEAQVYYADWSARALSMYALFFAISGALVAGLGGWLLVRALARAGVLDAFHAGRGAVADV